MSERPDRSTPRVAAVVGGGGAIGGEIARALQVQGRSVAVLDLDGDAAAALSAELAGRGAATVSAPVDLTDPSSVRSALLAVAEELGPVDILVNAAGWDDFVPFVDTDEEFWAQVIAVNYLGVLRTCHAVVGPMTERGWGRVVNVASDAGRVGSSLESVYAGAKGGVIAFGKSLAREVARHGVTVNAVCPGPTDTPLIAGMAERLGERRGDGPGGGERFVEGLRRAVPMRRLARPTEVAAAVAWFCGDDAGYVTGQTLSVSGGLTMA